MKPLPLLSLLLAVLMYDVHARRCFPNKTDIVRYIHHDPPLNMTIQTSRRISHQLVSHVMKIILEEELGYQHVQILPETNMSVDDVYNGFGFGIKSPAAMVNLEVLVSPNFKLSPIKEQLAVTQCGSISQSGGRYGWFIPEELASRAPLAHHWSYFRSNQAGVFDIHDQDDLDLIHNNSYNSFTSRYYCEESYCNHSTFEPTHCQEPDNQCALLLTSYPDSTGFVVDHIEELELSVKVVWLGPNLAHVVKTLNEKYSIHKNSTQSLIFLEWTPEYSGMVGLNFSRVAMPNCETISSFLESGCKYEMTKIVKLAWRELARRAPPAYNTFHNIEFSGEDYQKLVEYYDDNSTDFESAACNWMKNNTEMWKTWSIQETHKEDLYIGGIYPLSVPSYNAWSISFAVDRAISAINNNSEVLSNYILQVYHGDGACQTDVVMKNFIDYTMSRENHRLLGILGPACSEAVEPLVGVATHYNTMVISYSAEGTSFADRNKYPYFFRTIGENKQFVNVYSKLFQELKWRRVAAVSEDGQKYTEYISFMGDKFRKDPDKTCDLIVDVKLARDRDDTAMHRYLQVLQEKSARVIIADVAESATRQLMCQAYRERMTSAQGYTWFLPSWLPADWYNTTIHNDTANNTTQACSVEQMIEAINGHFSLSHARFADDNDLMQEKITVAEWREDFTNRYIKKYKDILNSTDTSPYVGYAYDAVWAYALAADKLLKQYPEAVSSLHSGNTSKNFSHMIGDLNFTGVSGNIEFRGGSSRYSVINIFQWINEKYVLVGWYTPEVEEQKPNIVGENWKFNLTKVVWLTPDGARPDDGEVKESCAFESLAIYFNISCNAALVVFNLLIFLLLGILIFVLLFYIKRRYDKRIQETEQFMMSMGLDALTATKIYTLDKWEIPRDRVVINRKLGEGAFGTVYGGEANFPEGRGWTAVAVKTLKVGSGTEEKLDFLSEAEAMKRFDHKNIVKLLAVCTKSEPVYAIMEFMLYGDLKTYLLARRHLVNEKYTEESEDISNKKLTSMALDVARALSYLADLKYVHRDVACRNCLVNSNRVVKLGDFGMTRLIFENDYYKFSRKGMLPVRWMSPESLGLGIFSPASDVWSYGVLLYEIITFGSFPFQGYSNNQVLEYVKKGNTITIPKGVKPQLEGLIKSCWKVDHKARPQASEIVEFLANSPRLLSPCLDVPLSSVQREHYDELPELLELPAPLLPDHLRKCSVSVTGGAPSLECPISAAPSVPPAPALPKIPNGVAKQLVLPSVVSSATNPTYMSADFGDSTSFDDAFDDTPVFNKTQIKKDYGFKSNDFCEEQVSFV